MIKTAVINLATLKAFLNKTYAKDEAVLQATTFIDALLRDTPSQKFPTLVGKSSYFDSGLKQNVFDVTRGVELWRGVFQSARPSPGYMSIVVDVAHTAFYRSHMRITDLLVTNLGLKSAQAIVFNPQFSVDKPRRDILKLLKGFAVYTKHTTRRDKGTRSEKIFSVDWSARGTARAHQFEFEGKQITVQQFFAKQYNIKLEYPDLPLLEMSGGKVRLPMELCYVAVGQRFPNNLLSPIQTAKIVEEAAQPPNKRLESIQANVKSLAWSADPMLKNYDLEVSPTPIIAKARLFPAPALNYQSPKAIAPKQGQWRVQGNKLCKSVKLSSWGILKLANDDTSLFENEIVKSGSILGVEIAARKPYIQSGNPAANMSQVITNFWKATGNHFNAKPQLLIIILPSRGGSALYGEVKRVCDTEIGVPSQCIAAGKLRKATGKYCVSHRTINSSRDGSST